MAKKPEKKPDIGTTGHEWDGIEELNNPLPRWWLWTFYATIIWAFFYVIAYPAWPLINKATPGVLGYSSRADVAADIAATNEANAPLEARIVSLELDEIAGDAEVGHFARAGGAAVFRTVCAQCHGAGAGGAPGFPNLLDDDWLWGGDLNAIYLTVKHGIRDEADPDTRFSQMPAFGEFLSRDEIRALTQHVLHIAGQEHDAALAVTGAGLYAENCASCHGDAGMGDREQGAPNLTDAIWLWGNTPEAITTSITNARFGVMPSWQTRLTEAQIRQVTVFVHQLGGG
ncbi:MAG: cytochrome-c oxidase, cbb3-type subunit III [Paracoccaceae bacterium]